jgi:hypothetical protein
MTETAGQSCFIPTMTTLKKLAAASFGVFGIATVLAGNPSAGKAAWQIQAEGK